MCAALAGEAISSEANVLRNLTHSIFESQWSTATNDALVLRTPDISKMDEETRKMWIDSQGEIVMNDFEPKRRFHNHGVYSCDRCGRTYVRKDSLSRHLQWECGKEPQFQCPFCPQKCKRKSHQLRHIQRQHQDKIHLLSDRDQDLEELIK
ncbi:Longitudinals lacking protein, isoforms A/B/D/L [Frankliniella fusca]|uniref:Longitudinals lacking protein, isoforms A/B/D/L n=1 Tax=Frankliniella fusca TaxID=407009 RepID=A0AAE1H6H9_9NEOP|nr:Longitudinals lacking protein, isoforms A/B/D/L [Frankliniella fusca]